MPGDGLTTVLHAEHPCDEIKILGDAQVFVETEPLSHIADFSLY